MPQPVDAAHERPIVRARRDVVVAATVADPRRRAFADLPQLDESAIGALIPSAASWWTRPF